MFSTVNVIALNLVGFLLVILILTIVHEWGHFYVARCCGVRVLEFSVGFGKLLYGFKDKSDTQFSLRMIPLGGYVNLLGEKEDSAKEPGSFKAQSLWKRVAIIIAGPLINLFFAVLLYALILSFGVEKIFPILGEVPTGSIAYQAGFREGQQILEVDREPVFSWKAVLKKIDNREKTSIQFKMTDSSLSEKDITLLRSNFRLSALEYLDLCGLRPWEPGDLIIEGILPGFPAANTGLAIGDRILAINEISVKTRSQLIKMVQAQRGQLIQLKIQNPERTEIKNFKIKISENGFLGVKFGKIRIPKSHIWIDKLGPLRAMQQGFSTVLDYSSTCVQMIPKLFKESFASGQLAGPIGIAEQAGSTLQQGWVYFINFLAIMSINLGILNLFPLPVLDGGRICLELLDFSLKRFNKKIPEAILNKILNLSLILVIAMSLGLCTMIYLARSSC